MTEPFSKHYFPGGDSTYCYVSLMTLNTTTSKMLCWLLSYIVIATLSLVDELGVSQLGGSWERIRNITFNADYPINLQRIKNRIWKKMVVKWRHNASRLLYLFSFTDKHLVSCREVVVKTSKWANRSTSMTTHPFKEAENSWPRTPIVKLD